MAKLIVHIGASADRNLGVAFRPVLQAARAARVQVGNEMAAAGKATGDGIKKGADAAEKEFAKLATQAARWHKQMVRDAERAIADEVRAAERGARQRERMIAAMVRDAQRGQEAMSREAERQEGRRANAASRATASAARRAAKETREHDRMAGVAARALGRAGASVVGGVVQGAGVDTSLSSLVAKGADLETRTVDLANSGYMPGKDGANGKRQDPRKLAKELRDVGSSSGIDATVAAEGLQSFVGKTGDLETGRNLMKDLARYSKATGAELSDMASAAGDVSNALGDTDNKAEKVKAVMRAAAAMGKEGAVEIKDLAKQMAKLGAASGTFAGNPTKVMAEMGMLAQMGRAHGGAASASQAATGVGSFTATFSKGARLHAFEKLGVKVNDPGTGLKKLPSQIIQDAIRASSSQAHGGMGKFDENMGSMFSDAGARRTTKGFENIYKQHGGGEAGLAAVRDAMTALTNATMNEKEVADSFSRAMGTTQSKAAIVNNKLAEMAEVLAGGVLAGLKEFGPDLKTAADGLASFGSGLGSGLRKIFAGLIGDSKVDDQKARFAADALSGNAHGLARQQLDVATPQYLPDAKGNLQLQPTKITEAQAKQGDETEAALATATDAMAKRVADERRDLGFGSKVNTQNDETVRKWIAEAPTSPTDASGKKYAAQYLKDQEMQAQMQEHLAELRTSNKAMLDAMTRGLVVVLKNDAPPKVDASGRTDPED